MGRPNAFPEAYKIVSALQPATDAAGRSGAYVSLKTAHYAWIVAHLDQGNAATVALTIQQAQAIAGTGSKAITVLVPIWADLDTAASDALVPQTAAVSFTTDAGVKRKMVVFGIDPSTLDVAGGFDCIRVTTGASNVANITSAAYYLESRYPQATPPSVVVD